MPQVDELSRPTAGPSTLGASSTAEPYPAQPIEIHDTGGTGPVGRAHPTTRRLPDVSALLAITVAFIALVVSTRRAIAEPLWYDEQWRGYFLSVGHGWWSEIAQSNAPMSAGWYAAERAAIFVVGNRESTLRLTSMVWLVVMAFGVHALARRWMRVSGAAVLALLVMTNGLLLSYSFQLKPYVADAAGTVIALAALLYARDARNTRLRILAFAAATFGLVLAAPAVFVIVPVIGCLLLEWWRRRRHDRVLLVGSVATLLIGGLHLRLFVMRQSGQTKGTYWDPNMAPHTGLSALARFVWEQTRSFVPGFVTDAYRADFAPGAYQTKGWSAFYSIRLTARWSTALGVILAVLLALGVWHAVLSAQGRIVVAGMAMSFPLTLIASWMRLWPYGFVRTNYYLVPLLYLLCGLGMVRLGGLLATAIRCARHGVGIGRRVAAVAATGGCAAALAAGVVAATVAASVSLGAARAAMPRSPLGGYGRNLNEAVLDVRRHADQSTAVVVAGSMAFRGWQYYMFQRDGLPGTEVPASRTTFLTQHGDPRLLHFLTSRADLNRLYYYVPLGTTGRGIAADARMLQSAGYCRSGRTSYVSTGLLTAYKRCK